MKTLKHTLRTGLLMGVLFAFSTLSYGHGMQCEKPTIVAIPGTSVDFSFNCINTTGKHFNYYTIFALPVAGAAVTVETDCPTGVASGASCPVNGTFYAPAAGTYTVDFDDEYVSERHYGIFCNGEQGCINATVASLTTSPMEVGYYASSTTGKNAPLIMNYNGSSWSSVDGITNHLPSDYQTSPATGNAELFSVTCTGTTCTGVGAYASSTTGESAPLIMNYNGSSWSSVDGITNHLPSDYQTSPATGNAELVSVTCTGTTCTGVGVYASSTTGELAPLIMNYNGSSWSSVDGITNHLPSDYQTSPATGNAELFSVTCTGTTCTGVGAYASSTTGESAPLIMNYNGSSWSSVDGITNHLPSDYQTSPATGNAELVSVTCTGTTCTGVGGYVSSTTGESAPLIMNYNGSSWSSVDGITNHLPSDYQTSPATGNAELVSVTCTGTTCTGVGVYASSTTGELAPLIMNYNGSSWSSVDGITNHLPSDYQTSPATGNAELFSVTCTGTTCTGVGAYASSTTGKLAPLIMNYNGSSWSSVDGITNHLPSDYETSPATGDAILGPPFF